MPRPCIPYRRDLKRPSQSPRRDPSERLVIEVDGDSHFTERGRQYDETRTAQLQAMGVRVMRVTNVEVMQDFEGVCAAILRIIAKP
jgi:very-short-patch-repair endonuclease